jgi:hypothetical protein
LSVFNGKIRILTGKEKNPETKEGTVGRKRKEFMASNPPEPLFQNNSSLHLGIFFNSVNDHLS